MGQEENLPQKQIMDYAKNQHYKIDLLDVAKLKLYRVNSIGIRGRRSTLPPGFSDLCGRIRIKGFELAIPIYVEVKKPDEKCSNKEQISFLKEAQDDGCIAFWTNSLLDFKLKLKDALSDIIHA
jgi:hypothetical protein